MGSYYNLFPELDESEQYNGFWGKSFGQAWHWFKDRRRSNSVSLNVYLTYVTLPWHRIIAGWFSITHFYLFFQITNLLKEYDYKDYILIQRMGVGETNILQQILSKSANL